MSEIPVQRFWRPIVHEVAGMQRGQKVQKIPCITYPERGQGRLAECLPRDRVRSVQRFVGKVIAPNLVRLTRGGGPDYLVAIPWMADDELMLDVWSARLTQGIRRDADPDVIVDHHHHSFVGRNRHPAEWRGVTTGSRLVVLGYEAGLQQQASSLEEYLCIKDRQQGLPPECRADESFYIEDEAAA